MPKLLIFDAFTLLIPEKTVANYALLRCKTFSLKIWVCKIFDKFHVWGGSLGTSKSDYVICARPLSLSSTLCTWGYKEEEKNTLLCKC